MSDVYEQRQSIKAERERYRSAARDYVRRVVEETNLEVFRVPQHANVSPVEDGAFVDCVIWVPKSEIKD